VDRIETMRAFVAVARQSSFSQAADRLQLSPQLVSKYVSRLEETLGVRLLNRSTRRVSLTEAGRVYLLRAEELLESFDDIQHQLGDLQTSARGELRISAPVSFASRHMGRLIASFQAAHPGVTVDLQLNDRKVDIVDEGFDVAIRIGRLKSSSLIARYLAPVQLVFCASPDYLKEHGQPETPAQLQTHRCLGYSYMEQPPDIWPDAGNVIRSNNGDLLVQCAIEGAGIALQPTFIAGDALAAGQLVPILHEFTPEPFGLYAVYAHRTLLASKVRTFVDFMGGYFGEIPYWDRY
tara:strand:- start:758618 stop:759496 length:879 start_codon:yes stop_codon:yes gene_type:complete